MHIYFQGMSNTRANARIDDESNVDQEVPLQVPLQDLPQAPIDLIGENVTHASLGRLSKC